MCRPPGADHGALLAWLGGPPGRRGELRARRDGGQRGGRLRGARRHAPPRHRHAAARAPGVAGPAARADRVHRRRRCWTTRRCWACSPSAGLPVQRTLADGEVQLTFPLPGDDADPNVDSYLDSVARRESRADVASLRYLLAPRSVAVIGASRRPRTVGPVHPAQHRARRLRRPGLRRQPARPQHGGHPLRRLGRGPARGARPGGHRGARGGGARGRRCVRPPRGAGPGGHHLRPGRRGRGPAGHLPAVRHAAGRAELPGRRWCPASA